MNAQTNPESSQPSGERTVKSGSPGVSKTAAIFWSIGFVLALIFAVVVVRGFQIAALVQPPPPPPPTVVTSAEVQKVIWEQTAESVGSVTSVMGVTVAAEVGGTVKEIHFESGTTVEEGALLVQLDISSEEAQLRAAEADAQLAEREVERSRRLQFQNTIADAAVDQAEAQLKKTLAQVDEIKAAISKKTIRAPFSGRIGIRQVALGEVLSPGAPIVSLQALDQVFVNFNLPQQRFRELRSGQKVRATTDAYPGIIFEGELSAINPELDQRTRGIQLQATFPNRDEKLRPGMFVRVQTVLDQSDQHLVVPATAVLYSPFGDSVFVIEEQPAKNGIPGMLHLSQRVVRPGITRGDYISIEGVPEDAQVVSSGLFKLSNGMSVKVDNRLAPKALEAPKPTNS